MSDHQLRPLLPAIRQCTVCHVLYVLPGAPSSAQICDICAKKHKDVPDSACLCVPRIHSMPWSPPKRRLVALKHQQDQEQYQ